MNEIIPIPKGWELKKLSELVKSKKGKKPSNLFLEKKADMLPYVDIKAFEKKILTNFGEKDDGVVCQKNDILVVWDGSRSGLVGIGIRGLVGSTIVSLKCSELVLPMYLYYFLKSKYNLINSDPKGGSIPHVKPDLFWSLSVPLPSLEIQKKIVQKLDYVLKEMTEKIKQLIFFRNKYDFNQISHTYKQELIKNAFSGKFTNEYRIKNKITKKDIINSLKKILPEKIDVILEHDEILRLKIKNSIPNEWLLVNLEDICDIQMGQSPPGSSYSKTSGIPLLNGPTEFTDMYPIEKQFTTNPTKICQKNDLLICVRGSTTGRMNWADKPYCIGRGLASISPQKDIIDTNLLFYFLDYKTHELRQTDKGFTFPNLSKRELLEFQFPLLFKNEQDEMLKILKSKILKNDKIKQAILEIESNVEQNLKKLQHIHSSIIEIAFTGKLIQ
jgi:type I restriction enzyme, S subunit